MAGDIGLVRRGDLGSRLESGLDGTIVGTRRWLLPVLVGDVLGTSSA